jgi:uncharacterized protein (TIGR00288 family)
MTNSNTPLTMAVFLDLENLAIGARDAGYPTFDVRKVLTKLLLRGNIVVKKAYSDFEQYREMKKDLHEAAFELIEIPHVRQAGKNSADIRMVVDALDLCYTKPHVDTFVIMSGDSDFSPLVSKLRENAKTLIGVGVKSSSSDLFINNCDEFIYYDDLVRKEPGKAGRSSGKSSETKSKSAKTLDVRKAIDTLAETLEDMIDENADDAGVWGSALKQAIKRREPGFNERAYGVKTFNDLLLEAQKQNRVKLEREGNVGNYMVRPVE